MKTISSNYFNYSIHDRINRKSHFEGVHSHKLEALIHCTEKPEIYMPDSCLVMSGRRVMDGSEVIEKTRLIRVKIHFSNGIEPFRRIRKYDSPGKYLKYPIALS